MEDIEKSLPTCLYAGCSKFAYATIKDRMPIIIVKTLDQLSRNKLTFGNPSTDFDDVKFIIRGFSKLRYEIMTDKCLTMLESESTTSDIKIWNEKINELSETTWFTAPWLFVECYMYRRIMNIIYTSPLPSLDPFKQVKIAAFKNNLGNIIAMCSSLKYSLTHFDITTLKDDLHLYLLYALWSNEFDLSLSAGNLNMNNINGAHNLKQDVLVKAANNMAVDELDVIIGKMLKCKNVPNTLKSRSLAIIMDNCGPEMVADFILGEFLLSVGIVDKVVFYPKACPWFVSDVTAQDIEWFLNEGLLLSPNSNTKNENMIEYSGKWSSRFSDGSFSVVVHPFWTLPCGYNKLRWESPELYFQLMHNSLFVIFKGDLNYRKLLEDRAWSADSCEHKQTAYQRCFMPVSSLSTDEITSLISTLRVAKSDVAIGLTEKRLSELIENDTEWWTKGQIGFAQIICPMNL